MAKGSHINIVGLCQKSVHSTVLQDSRQVDGLEATAFCDWLLTPNHWDDGCLRNVPAIAAQLTFATRVECALIILEASY